jgi:hypothetical protein
MNVREVVLPLVASMYVVGLTGWNLQEGLPGQARALIYDEGGDATLFQ